MFGIPEWAVGVGFIMLCITLAKALSGRIAPPRELRGGGGRNASRRDLAEAVDDVQRRVAQLEDARTKPGELEAFQARLSEVEERLDFAERLLSKPKS